MFYTVNFLVIAYLLFIRAVVFGENTDTNTGDRNDNKPSDRIVHKCGLSNSQFSFNVLPGVGWDNLENVERGRVLKVGYKQCLESPDGRYLLPDYVNMRPHRHSIVQLDSKLYSHFGNYTSSTAHSVNVDANYATPNYQISGSFSWENKKVKEDQIREKSSVSRVELRYNIFGIGFQPDAELDPQFKNRLLDIGASLLQKEQDSLYPQYLAELLIRDFGTHVIRHIDAGALLTKVDVLTAEYMKKMKGNTNVIRASASYSMTKKMDIKITNTNTDISNQADEYDKNCASTTIESIGGKPFGSDFKLEDWEKDLDTNLVPIDRVGDPLHYVVTGRTLPELGLEVVLEVSKYVEKAITSYYAANTRVGCMDFFSPNFDEDANIDSGLCEPPKVIFNLGGVYQTCSGDYRICSDNGIQQINPATGGYSCPSGYLSVLLNTGLYRCERRCAKFLFWNVDCYTFCSYHRLYWCAPNNKQTYYSAGIGYLFGGIYTKSQVNPVTNAYKCPQYHIPLKFGAEATVCLSSDPSLGRINSIPYGGFYSCKVGNPLALEPNPTGKTMDSKYWAKGCQSGYSDHLAVIDRGCQISYCAKVNIYNKKSDPPLKKPPYIDINYGPNITVLNQFTTPMGDSFELSDDGMWIKSQSVKSAIASGSPKYIAYSVIGSIAIATIIVVVILAVNKVRVKISSNKNEHSINNKTSEGTRNDSFDMSETTNRGNRNGDSSPFRILVPKSKQNDNE